MACGIQFSDQGWNLAPLHGELGGLATGPPWKSQDFLIGPIISLILWCSHLNIPQLMDHIVKSSV